MTAMRPETTSEHIARDMREGRFPERSEPQMVADLAAVQPAQVMVSNILKAAGEEYVLEHVMETDDHRMGRKSTVRGMMVRLGLYPELEGAIDAALEPQPDPRDEVIARLVDALGFYADMTAWTQPPVKTREGLLTLEYENQASKMQKDRGAKARAALAAAKAVQK